MTPILNRDFQHPADGWYMIEPRGEHPNRAAGVTQVIDDTAIRTIVSAFNTEAEAQGASFPGMLVDHEHFSHDADKETRAFGWLTRLENRTDGVYGQIRWTGTGRQAVDSGDYRFFSTEYDLSAATALNAEPQSRISDPKSQIPSRIRPLRLMGLTLTNKPNNKGGKPITNREEFAADGDNPPKAASPTTNQRNKMTSIASKLGLAAEASEDAILAEVTKLLNRATDAEGKLAPLQKRVNDLEAADLRNRETQADADLAAIKDKLSEDEYKSTRASLVSNREAALPLLKLLNIAQAKPEAGSKPMFNRAEAKTPADKKTVDRTQLLNREIGAYRAAHNCDFQRAWNAVKAEKPELFTSETQ